MFQDVSKKWVGLHVFEAAYLGALAILPFIVVQKYVSILVITSLLSSGLYFLITKKMKRTVVKEEKSVMITGCDTGIGNSLARRLDNEGFNVFATCLDTESSGADKLRESTTGRLHVLKMDISNEESIKECMDKVKILCADKGLWCLVNNAGVKAAGDIEFSSMKSFRDCAEVNLFGMIDVSKRCIPLIREAKGRFVNITSCQGRMSLPCQSAYSISNFGAEAFSNALRLEMRKFDVPVVVVEPGNFWGTSAMLCKRAMHKVKNEFDELWENADDELKKVYHKHYIDKQYHTCHQMSQSSNMSLLPVIKVLEDAITNKKPNRRYVVGASNFHAVDKLSLLVRLQPYMPTFLTDYFIDSIYGTSLKRHH